jgi:hypothetical protein
LFFLEGEEKTLPVFTRFPPACQRIEPHFRWQKQSGWGIVFSRTEKAHFRPASFWGQHILLFQLF